MPCVSTFWKKSKKPRKFPPRLVKSVAGGMLLWRIRRRKANLCPPIRFLCSTETNINLLKSPCDFCTWLLQHHRLAAASTCKVDKGRRCLYRCDSFVPMCSGLHQTGTFFCLERRWNESEPGKERKARTRSQSTPGPVSEIWPPQRRGTDILACVGTVYRPALPCPALLSLHRYMICHQLALRFQSRHP